MKNKKGFTLIELLIVISIIAILGAIVIVAINPAEMFGRSNNAQRYSNVNTILSAINQYTIDAVGKLPVNISSTSTEICFTGAADCTGLVDLSEITQNEKYILKMPIDPSCSGVAPTVSPPCDPNGIGYFVQETPNERIIVSAPYTELSVTEIKVSR